MWKYDKLLTSLIEMNKTNRNEQNEKMLSKFLYCKDFCTIQLDIGRGVGKTEYIFRHAKKNDLVILSNRHGFEYFRNSASIDKPVFIVNRRENPYRFIASLRHRMFQAKIAEFDTIWIDDFSTFDKDKYSEDFIWELVNRQEKAPTLVLLG